MYIYSTSKMSALLSIFWDIYHPSGCHPLVCGSPPPVCLLAACLLVFSILGCRLPPFLTCMFACWQSSRPPPLSTFHLFACCQLVSCLYACLIYYANLFICRLCACCLSALCPLVCWLSVCKLHIFVCHPLFCHSPVCLLHACLYFTSLLGFSPPACYRPPVYLPASFAVSVSVCQSTVLLRSASLPVFSLSIILFSLLICVSADSVLD